MSEAIQETKNGWIWFWDRLELQKLIVCWIISGFSWWFSEVLIIWVILRILSFYHDFIYEFRVLFCEKGVYSSFCFLFWLLPVIDLYLLEGNALGDHFYWDSNLVLCRRSDSIMKYSGKGFLNNIFLVLWDFCFIIGKLKSVSLFKLFIFHFYFVTVDFWLMIFIYNWLISLKRALLLWWAYKVLNANHWLSLTKHLNIAIV